jgi:hypothetical protein
VTEGSLFTVPLRIAIPREHHDRRISLRDSTKNGHPEGTRVWRATEGSLFAIPLRMVILRESACGGRPKDLSSRFDQETRGERSLETRLRRNNITMPERASPS